MNGTAVESEETAATRRQRLARLWQFLPLLLGLVAFEVTANPMLGTAVACLKFGWEEFATALWLLGSDPVRMRGIACAGFHAAFGFIKAAVTGFAMMVVVMVFIQFVPVQPNAAAWDGQVVSALLTILASGAAFAMMLGLGITAALLGRVRVWVGPESHWARRHRQWPPRSLPPFPRAGNAAAALLKGACVLGGIAAGFSILIVLARCGLLSSPALILVSLALYPIGSVGLASRLFRRIATRVVAPTPRHCWPEAGADLCELQVIAERPCSDA